MYGREGNAGCADDVAMAPLLFVLLDTREWGPYQCRFSRMRDAVCAYISATELATRRGMCDRYESVKMLLIQNRDRTSALLFIIIVMRVLLRARRGFAKPSQRYEMRCLGCTCPSGDYPRLIFNVTILESRHHCYAFLVYMCRTREAIILLQRAKLTELVIRRRPSPYQGFVRTLIRSVPDMLLETPLSEKCFNVIHLLELKYRLNSSRASCPCRRCRESS